MKKINFEELCDLVLDVDPIFSNTYPINFKVDGKEYLVGIGNYDCGDDTGDDYGVFGQTEDLQYLARFEDDIVRYIDVQPEDCIVDVEEMLMTKCKITPDSEIILYEDSSFDGSQDYTVEWVFCTDDVQENALKNYEQATTVPITFDDLHRLVSEVDYINDESYPIEFLVDGVKYRAGIGPYCLDDFQNVVGDSDNKEYYEQFTDFFYGYEDEVQYLSRIEDEEIGEEYILDACDPDDMSFKGIGEMLKKCCNITESSEIGLSTSKSFNGNQHNVWWMDLTEDVITQEKECIKQWKAEMEEDGEI